MKLQSLRKTNCEEMHFASSFGPPRLNMPIRLMLSVIGGNVRLGVNAQFQPQSMIGPRRWALGIDPRGHEKPKVYRKRLAKAVHRYKVALGLINPDGPYRNHMISEHALARPARGGGGSCES
jgi:hypothetical protein